MTKKRDAAYWRRYRQRRREAADRADSEGGAEALEAAQPSGGGLHHWQSLGAILVCHRCGNRAASDPLPPQRGCVGAPTQEELDSITGVRNTREVSPGYLVANVQPNRPVRVQGEQAPAPRRHKRMKSDEEIKSFITNAMMQYGQSPRALLHVITGYVTQLQELMKRDHEDIMAERACMHRHPGKVAEGVYCKLCHDAEMAGRFGTIPGQGTQLIYPDEERPAAQAEAADDLLDAIKLKPVDKE